MLRPHPPTHRCREGLKSNEGDEEQAHSIIKVVWLSADVFCESLRLREPLSLSEYAAI